MNHKLWSSLRPGDWVDIVAPGMSPKPHTLKGIVPFLKSWGLNVRLPSDLVGKDLICSHSKEYRFNSLKEALTNKQSKLIWCVRGGYGSLHLLDQLNKMKAPPIKCFLGLSDVTSLHNFFNQKWGWSTLHGCNIDRFALNTGSKSEEQRLKKVLFGIERDLEYFLTPLNQKAKNSNTLKATVVGGNLITLQSSFGTFNQLKTSGHILFFEDIGERAYRVDRVFEHMRQLNLFKGARAVVLGQFTGGKEPSGKNLLPTYFKQWAESQSLPVFSGLSSGHGKNQKPLPLGARASLSGGKKPVLKVSSGARSESE